MGGCGVVGVDAGVCIACVWCVFGDVCILFSL